VAGETEGIYHHQPMGQEVAAVEVQAQKGWCQREKLAEQAIYSVYQPYRYDDGGTAVSWEACTMLFRLQPVRRSSRPADAVRW
jgi:hypothetical protein